MTKRGRKRLEESEVFTDPLISIDREKMKYMLGHRLREIRLKQGMSMRSLAEKSDVSANTMSLIENGKTSPSVSTLQQIAVALQVPLTAFFEKEIIREPAIFTKYDQRERTKFIYGQVEVLGSGIEGLQPFIIHLDPHSESGTEPLTQDGKEFVYCLTGQVVYHIAGKAYLLERGDSLVISAKLPHTWFNPLDETSTIMVVIACAI
jgi:transcriptional regulator with XRE-family HTH domain